MAFANSKPLITPITPITPIADSPAPTAPAPDWQRRLAITLETMRDMSRHTDPEQMVRSYAKRMRALFPQDGMISLSRRELPHPKLRITRNSRWEHTPNPWKQKELLPILDGGILSDLIYGEEPVLIDELALATADPARPFLEGYRSLLAIPHFHDGAALNMVVHLWKKPSAFNVEKLPDLVLTSNLFGRATFNLHLRDELGRAYAEVDRELAAVADIQRSLLPKSLPRIPTMELAAYYQTSRRAGGDYYDLYPLADGNWGIFIADVSGHGTPAAVMMAITHSIAHAYPGPPLPPGSMLDYLNRKLVSLYTTDISAFVTAFYGVYQPAKRLLTYASAGHNPPRLRRAAGGVSALDTVAGIPLGIASAHVTHPYEESAIDLHPGDQLLFYTDGITEVFNNAGAMFGYARLDEIAARPCATAQGMIDGILEALEVFRQDRPLLDDRTILAARMV